MSCHVVDHKYITVLFALFSDTCVMSPLPVTSFSERYPSCHPYYVAGTLTMFNMQCNFMYSVVVLICVTRFVPVSLRLL